MKTKRIVIALILSTALAAVLLWIFLSRKGNSSKSIVAKSKYDQIIEKLGLNETQKKQLAQKVNELLKIDYFSLDSFANSYGSSAITYEQWIVTRAAAELGWSTGFYMNGTIWVRVN